MVPARIFLFGRNAVTRGAWAGVATVVHHSYTKKRGRRTRAALVVEGAADLLLLLHVGGRHGVAPNFVEEGDIAVGFGQEGLEGGVGAVRGGRVA